MVIDVFLFLDEVEILELRLETLEEAVDRFVLVRGDRTFRGRQIREASVDRAIARLKGLFPLSVVTVRLPEEAPSAWNREHFQRAAMGAAAARAVRPSADDTILTSDVDEIPNPRGIADATRITAQREIACFCQLHTYFALNLLDREPWYGTRAARWDVLRQTSAQDIRNVGAPLGQRVIADGGWHFGWTGGNDAIRNKVAAFCHHELDRPELMTDAHLDDCLARRRTLHSHHRLETIPLCLLPKPVSEHPEKYKHMLA